MTIGQKPPFAQGESLRHIDLGAALVHAFVFEARQLGRSMFSLFFIFFCRFPILFTKSMLHVDED